MSKTLSFFVFVAVLMALPLSAQVIPWTVVEDTLYIPDLLSRPGLTLNKIMADDTAGIGWQGQSGRTAWLNGTRVYVLQKGGAYPMTANFLIGAYRKLMIRAEDGNYKFPRGNDGDYHPIIYASGSPYPGRLFRANGTNDTIILKNVVLCGYNEFSTDNLNMMEGNLLEINNGCHNSSIFLDGCMLKSNLGQLMQIGAGGPVNANTIRALNTIFADMGFLGKSNLGAGRGIDLRNSRIDTIDIQNCTFINWQDRAIRHYLSQLPIYNIIIKHNTFVNGMSYHAMFSLGHIDSTGAGTFEIKDNLFLDNFAMGPDTDAVRQSEMVDNPDLDPVSGTPRLCWIVARPNTTPNITPWAISHNYYGISDSGIAMRNLIAPYLRVPVSQLYGVDAPEPILTSDIWRQLKANGYDSALAFIKISNLKMKKVPPLMTKMMRWYYTVAGDGDPITGEGAGAGRQKTGGAGRPADHFRYVEGIWIYDFNRRTYDWYLDSLDCSFYADVEPVSSDGKVVGATYWRYLGSTQVGEKSLNPIRYSLTQNYPNPFNPTTSFKYTIEKPGFVSIKIYNVLGQEVATLVNEHIKQAGTYNVTWDASEMNSGIYFYKMQSGNFRETRKMVLMK